MRIVKEASVEKEIENKQYFVKQAKISNKPYALVRRTGDQSLMYIPLSWMHRPETARKASPKDILMCYYSTDLTSWPYFRYKMPVNVIQVFEGKLNLNCR